MKVASATVAALPLAGCIKEVYLADLEQIASTNGEHVWGNVMVHNGDIDIAGGFAGTPNGKSQINANWETYDSSKNVWTPRKEFTLPLVEATHFTLDDRIFFVGGKGANGISTSDVFSYNLRTGQRNDDLRQFPDTSASDHAVVANGTPYFFDNKTMHRYEEVNDRWHEEKMPEHGEILRAAVSDGKIYTLLFAGISRSFLTFGGNPIVELHRYDTSKKQWEQIELPTELWSTGHSCYYHVRSNDSAFNHLFEFQGKMHFLVNEPISGNHYLSTTYVLNQRDSWEKVSEMASPRDGYRNRAILNGTMYVIGKDNPAYSMQLVKPTQHVG